MECKKWKMYKLLLRTPCSSAVTALLKKWKKRKISLVQNSFENNWENNCPQKKQKTFHDKNSRTVNTPCSAAVTALLKQWNSWETAVITPYGARNKIKATTLTKGTNLQ